MIALDCASWKNKPGKLGGLLAPMQASAILRPPRFARAAQPRPAHRKVRRVWMWMSRVSRVAKYRRRVFEIVHPEFFGRRRDREGRGSLRAPGLSL